MKKQFDIGFGHLGNGITVWNRAKEVHGDYEKIAHIGCNRSITWYLKNLPNEVVTEVKAVANGNNFSISTSQDHMKVFNDE